MHGTTIFTAALLAVGALAVPMPQQKAALSKRTFKVGVKGFKGRGLSPAQEMRKTFGKYGWLQEGFSPFGDDVDIFNLPSLANVPNLPESFGVPDLGSLLGGGYGDDGASDGPSAPSTSASAATSSPAPFPAGNATATATGTATVAPTSTSTGSPTSGSGGSAEVTTTPENNDSEYLTPVTLGGQTLNLDFDTGSADLWVFSTLQPSSEQGQHSLYDPTKSSTYSKLNGGTWKITYGDNSGASGTVGYDVVAVGSATVTKQAIELATQVSTQFEQDANNDGLLGLAFSTINTVKVNGQPQAQNTWFENVKDSLDAPLFSVDLKEQTGTYEFGAIDDTAHTGSINYVDIDNSGGFWQFESTQYTVGGKAATNTKPSPAIADTGTSLILTDDNVVQAFYAQVQGAKNDQTQGGYVYPCSATLPDFGIQIGSYTLNLKGSGLTYAPVDSSGQQCFGGIQSNAGAGYQIFGDVMLRQAYAVFDAGNNRFGVAPKAS